MKREDLLQDYKGSREHSLEEYQAQLRFLEARNRERLQSARVPVLVDNEALEGLKGS